MDSLKNFVQEHKTLSYIFGLGFMVFINAAGFPIYNLNKERPLVMIILTIFVILLAIKALGLILYAIFPKIKPLFLLMGTLFFSALGLVFRYIIEMGEASNTYNFTLPNVLLHLGVFTILTYLSWFMTFRKDTIK